MYASHADKIVIAKVDATLNDVPDEIQGFPTIKLFKAGSKDAPVDYSGSRTVEDLANFIRDSGSHGIDASNSSADADDEGLEGVETEQMPNQAPAATKAGEAAESAAEGAAEATESAKEGIVDKVAAAAGKVKEAIMDDDDELGEHDEL